MSHFDAVSSNWTARVELAAAYRLLDKLGLNEGIENHASLMAPAANGQGEVMLIIPYGTHWSQVTASCLIGYSIEQEKILEGEGEMQCEAFNIHVTFHKLHPESPCVIYVHAPYSTAISMTKDFNGLPMTHQNSAFFYGRVAVDNECQGLAEDHSEGERMSNKIQDKSVLFLKHHGIVVVGPTVAMVMSDIYYLERACMYHILAASTGKGVDKIPEDQVKKAFDRMMSTVDVDSRRYFKAMMSVLRRDCPGFDK